MRGYTRGNRGFNVGLPGYDVGNRGFTPQDATPVLPTLIRGKAPTMRYHAKDAGAGGWAAADYGSDLSLVSAGSAPTYNNGSAFTAPGADDSVKGNAGKCYERTGDPTYGQPGTDDFWDKLILQYVSETTLLISQREDANEYWEYVMLPTGVELRIVGINSVALATGALVAGTWYVIDIVFDHSGSARIYLNGRAKQTTSVSSPAVLPCVPNIDMAILARSDPYAAPTNGSIAYYARWQGAGWLTSADQDSLVLQHYNDLIG